MLANAKRIFLFVGMVVGAGFATGRELMLYFYGKSLATVLLTAVIMGAVFSLFLWISRYYSDMPIGTIDRVVKVIVSLSIIAGFLVMTSGAERLLYEIFGYHYLGVLTGAVSALIAIRGIDSIKNVNLLIVPILLAMIVYITRGSVNNIIGKLSITSSVGYVAMNMLTAGYLILSERDTIRPRDIVICGVGVALIFGIILCLVISNISLYHASDMPMYMLALSRGYEYLGGGIIFVAIMSTLLGNARMIYLDVTRYTHNRCLAVFVLMTLAVVSKIVPFGKGVDIVYSIEGVVGVVYLGYLVVKVIRFFGRRRYILCNGMVK